MREIINSKRNITDARDKWQKLNGMLKREGIMTEIKIHLL